MWRDVLLLLGGAWLGAVLGVLLVFLLASGQPRYPEGRTWQRKG